jgi:hypothetical protein
MMFDEDDVNHMVNSNTRIPDGVINGSQYADIFKTLSEMLEKTNTKDFQESIRWVMGCINECYNNDDNLFSKEKAADVVTSLAYLAMTLCNGIDELGYKGDFFEHQNTEVIPQLFKECETIPWYDFSDDIKKLVEQEKLEEEENG